MIERELRRRQRAQAVLARVTVPHQDIFPGQGLGLMGDPAVFEQPDHGRQPHGLVTGVYKKLRKLFCGSYAF
jgi:hypothetical protein